MRRLRVPAWTAYGARSPAGSNVTWNDASSRESDGGGGAATQGGAAAVRPDLARPATRTTRPPRTFGRATAREGGRPLVDEACYSTAHRRHERRMRLAGGFVHVLDRFGRRPVAVLVTRDGRRVTAPLDELQPRPVVVSILLSLVGLLGLIGGSRREPGGTRRTER